MPTQSLFIEGRNCWRTARAQRLAFLVDSAAYFAAFAAAAEHAQESIFIVGWDVDSRARLVPDGVWKQQPSELGAFLKGLASRRRGLQVYVLEWDFAVIFALERESLAMRRRRWQTHRRVQFRMDGAHPAGASHHQKLAVVDDAIAFVGGIDLTIRRWDSAEHRAQDPRRVDPAGISYPPIHDVQVAVDGEAARALGHLVRERWRRATGGRIRPSQGGKSDLWPSGLTPDLEQVSVAIARTEPAYNGNSEVREVEALYLDAIAAAQRCIYMESQYFTSAVIGDALADRLREANGPEIVLVLPHKASGWLEQSTMDVLRARLLRRLCAADQYGHLRVYCPVVPDLDGACLNVHAKVLIVDERLVRIGSSNISNRSMGLDTECDVAVESAGAAIIESAIARFRDRLLGEHLGVSAREVAATLDAKQSLIATVEGLHRTGRTLEPLRVEVPVWRDQLIPDSTILDPERALVPGELFEECSVGKGRQSGGYALLRSGIALLILVGLVMAWRWTPLGDWFHVDMLVESATSLRGDPIAPLVVISGYVVGSTVLIPVTVLITATTLAFGPLLGFTYSLLGCLVSATLTYGLGYLLGHDIVRSLASAQLGGLSSRLAQHGLLAILIVRIVPVAPFVVLNVIAGASHIRLRDFVLGTFLGMLPGLLVMTMFGHQLDDVIRNPTLGTFLVLVGLAALIVLLTVWVRRHFLNGRSFDATDPRTDVSAHE
ncbi:MAG TPA: VTT domain-containing protein [Candidatus Tectomicrobia bacterium]|nr:VTT domain-containing protein [Candidatus Tectomicrobia bacterium]